MFSERVSIPEPRGNAPDLLEFVREGDVLVVTRLDRLARRTQELFDHRGSTCGSLVSGPGWC
jgi:DNA invertase Pin-like site-specific DNA recombinase